MKVGVCEDDEPIRRVLARGLRGAGHDVLVAHDGGEAVRLFGDASLDVLVMDIGLPDADGRDVCQALRARGIETPVLFLTARDAVVDRVAGFDAGGDDYVAKPFATVELVARIQALVRRAGGVAPVEAEGIRLDPVSHAVSADGREVALTPTEFRLLALLLARPGEAVRRRELVRAGWLHGAIVRENTLDAYVARIRRKLKQLDAAPEIRTVHGVGYRVG
jgi:two-component system response regulator MprA